MMDTKLINSLLETIDVNTLLFGKAVLQASTPRYQYKDGLRTTLQSGTSYSVILLDNHYKKVDVIVEESSSVVEQNDIDTSDEDIQVKFENCRIAIYFNPSTKSYDYKFFADRMYIL